MAMYRIKIALLGGQRFAYTGLFASGSEAVLQTLADYPGARSVSALFVRRSA